MITTFRALYSSVYMIRVSGVLALAGILSAAGPGAAPGPGACALPEGATPLPEPRVTAQQVEDGSAALKDFLVAVRDQFSDLSRNSDTASVGYVTYLGCVVRQEGSAYRSGSTYLVLMNAGGRVVWHAKAMSLSGRLLDPSIYRTILSSLGVEPTVLADLDSPDPGTRSMAFAAVVQTLSQEPDGRFDATTPVPGLRPGIPGASGHAAVYVAANFGIPLVLLAGFDVNESHVVSEEIDFGNPTVTAKDVVDRETLRAFVTQAGNFILELGGDFLKAKVAFRDPNGPWRHGSVYLYVLDRVSNVIVLHAAFPDRFELMPLVATVRDAVTGELILPQVIEAAKSDPEGGFVEYYFDDPADDTDSADIPKVGYAREFTLQYPGPDGVINSVKIIVGSGFYGRAAEVGTGPSTVVEATVLGDAVEGLEVAFSRAIAGRGPDYVWSAVTDAAGLLSLAISSADGVSGYYRARATNADGEVVGQWSSIPLNEGRRQALELTLGGGARVVRVASLATAEPVAAAKPAFAAETVPEASGLSPNSPNPFNSATVITYHLAGPGPVRLVIYNLLAQPVRTLVDESRAAGTYQVRWDARDDGGALLSTGVYFARLSYPGGVQTQRLLYVK